MRWTERLIFGVVVLAIRCADPGFAAGARLAAGLRFFRFLGSCAEGRSNQLRDRGDVGEDGDYGGRPWPGAGDPELAWPGAVVRRAGTWRNR